MVIYWSIFPVTFVDTSVALGLPKPVAGKQPEMVREIFKGNSNMLLYGRGIYNKWTLIQITHWGRVTHICVDNLTIIGSDNGLSLGRRQAIIWTNAWILSIGPLGTNFSEMLIKIYTISFRKMYSKMSSGKRRLFCLGLNVIKSQ